MSNFQEYIKKWVENNPLSIQEVLEFQDLDQVFQHTFPQAKIVVNENSERFRIAILMLKRTLGIDHWYDIPHLNSLVLTTPPIAPPQAGQIIFNGGDFYGYNGTTWISLTQGSSGGSSGTQGASGVSGFSGRSGLNGAQGISGYSGYSGFSGQDGVLGSDGASGYSGFSGYSGSNGSSGISGYSGQDGIIGSDGASGYSGFSGSGVSGFSGYSGAGSSGFSGYSGSIGSSGFSGYSGGIGSSGFSGYSGVGSSGFSGYSGAGTSGFSGYSGAGTSGFSGYSGRSGYSGVSGFSGYSGSGISGYSGRSGFSGFDGQLMSFWRYEQDTDTFVAPTSGYFRTDSFTLQASDSITINNATNTVEDWTILLQYILVNSIIKLVSPLGDYVYFSIYNIEIETTYAKFFVTPLDYDFPVPPSDGDLFRIIFYPAGANGTTGFSGISGYSGPSGYSGYSGASGFSGYSGRSGYSGYSGSNGISGSSGYSGYSGRSGYSGSSGYSGYSGISGFSGVGQAATINEINNGSITDKYLAPYYTSRSYIGVAAHVFNYTNFR